MPSGMYVQLILLFTFPSLVLSLLVLYLSVTSFSDNNHFNCAFWLSQCSLIDGHFIWRRANLKTLTFACIWFREVDCLQGFKSSIPVVIYLLLYASYHWLSGGNIVLVHLRDSVISIPQVDLVLVFGSLYCREQILSGECWTSHAWTNQTGSTSPGSNFANMCGIMTLYCSSAIFFFWELLYFHFHKVIFLVPFNSKNNKTCTEIPKFVQK